MSSLLITRTAVCSSFLALVWDEAGALPKEHPSGPDKKKADGQQFNIPSFFVTVLQEILSVERQC